MSFLIHWNHANSRFGSGSRCARIQPAVRAIFSVVRNVALRAEKLLVDAADIIAEARAQRAILESTAIGTRWSQGIPKKAARRSPDPPT
jgi:hypothetical protein